MIESRMDRDTDHLSLCSCTDLHNKVCPGKWGQWFQKSHQPQVNVPDRNVHGDMITYSPLSVSPYSKSVGLSADNLHFSDITYTFEQ